MEKIYRFKTREELGSDLEGRLPNCRHLLETYKLGTPVPLEWNPLLNTAIALGATTTNLTYRCETGQGATEFGCVKETRLDIFTELVPGIKRRVSKRFGIASLR